MYICATALERMESHFSHHNVSHCNFVCIAKTKEIGKKSRSTFVQFSGHGSPPLSQQPKKDWPQLRNRPCCWKYCTISSGCTARKNHMQIAQFADLKFWNCSFHKFPWFMMHRHEKECFSSQHYSKLNTCFSTYTSWNFASMYILFVLNVSAMECVAKVKHLCTYWISQTL